MRSRTSHEVRGLKFPIPCGPINTGSRTSHEVRGLKYHEGANNYPRDLVAPHTRCVD